MYLNVHPGKMFNHAIRRKKVWKIRFQKNKREEIEKTSYVLIYGETDDEERMVQSMKR